MFGDDRGGRREGKILTYRAELQIITMRRQARRPSPAACPCRTVLFDSESECLDERGLVNDIQLARTIRQYRQFCGA
jgi:hypothetical protein